MAKIIEKIESVGPNSQFFSLEFFPPKTAEGLQNLLPRLQRLRTLNPLFICITFSAGGITARKSVELADLCQNQFGLTTCLHLTCTNTSRKLINWVLAECKARGIRNILALRGDEPRPGEYAETFGDALRANAIEEDGEDKEEEVQFKYAVDLVRYIRRKFGDHFCIGTAAYPEGHPIVSTEHAGGYYQNAERDLPFLEEKIKAGADFVLTQLFYDVDYYLNFEHLLKNRKSNILKNVPIIPGLMPIQSWQSFSRTCKLAKVSVPSEIRERLELVKADDEGVKNVGVDVVSTIIERIKAQDQRYNKTNARIEESSSSSSCSESKISFPRGFHFYTLNLEKTVAQVLERCDLIDPQPSFTTQTQTYFQKQEQKQNGTDHHTEHAVKENTTPQNEVPIQRHSRRRRSSTAHNRVVISRSRLASPTKDYETFDDEAGKRQKNGDQGGGRDDTLAIAEGEGTLGKEATWDDFPNGRWGDARSPAYAPTPNYSLHPQLSPSVASKLWSSPTSIDDITQIFRQHLLGHIPFIPWSDDFDPVKVTNVNSQALEKDGQTGTEISNGSLQPETALIIKPLLSLNAKGWWTVASQPAVDAARSSDDVVGWGPRKGFVWQKPFVEFFVPSSSWVKLKGRFDALLEENERERNITYFAGNAEGKFCCSEGDESGVNPVTWGCFKGKEIITPTLIEPVSFQAWQTEAFNIWHEWSLNFPPGSATAKLLRGLMEDLWLVNVIGHDYFQGGKLWDILLEK